MNKEVTVDDLQNIARSGETAFVRKAGGTGGLLTAWTSAEFNTQSGNWVVPCAYFEGKAGRVVVSSVQIADGSPMARKFRQEGIFSS